MSEQETASAAAQERSHRKTRQGYVVSDKMDKTVVVAVEDRVKHRLYGKVLRQTSRLKAHDEQNSAAVGDRVRVMETRPQSATKRWPLSRSSRRPSSDTDLSAPVAAIAATQADKSEKREQR